MSKRALILVTLLAPAVALANGYSVPNVNPRDLAMADSTVAAQGDVAAADMNPAALSRVEGFQLSLGFSYLDNQNEWSNPATGGEATTLYKPVPPVALFAGYGGKFMDRGWGVALGLGVPAGGNVFWKEDWEGRFRIIEVDRKVYATYLTGGVELFPWLRVGGGAIYYRTTERLLQKLDFLTSEGTAELSTAGGKLSYELAVEITCPKLPLTLGIDYKHQAVQELEGDAHFEDVPASLQGTLADQPATHVLTIPNFLNVGLAYRPIKPLLLTLGWTLDRYEVYEEDRFSGTLGTMPDVVVTRNYGNGQTWRLGAEWDQSDRLTLRAGVLRDLSGLDTDTYSPTLPDGDTWAFTAGAAWKFSPKLSVSGALFYAPYDTVKVTGTEAFQGQYEPSAFIASVGVVWKPL
jgi:long-chain fatty acid transport protein